MHLKIKHKVVFFKTSIEQKKTKIDMLRQIKSLLKLSIIVVIVENLSWKTKFENR